MYLCAVYRTVNTFIIMKQQIFEALKAKFEGVSANILNRIADKLSKTVTSAEQVKTAVDGVTIQQVIESYADSRATEATQTAVHTYEQKYGLKDGVKLEQGSGGGGSGQGGTPVQTQQQQAGGTDQALLQAIQALQESNKQLSERLNQMDSDRTTSQRKQQLSGIISKLPESLRKAYERTPVDGMTDEQFNTLIGEVTTEVDGIVQATTQKGAIFGRPSATGGSGSQNGELSQEQQNAIAHRDNKPASDGQPF